MREDGSVDVEVELMEVREVVESEREEMGRGLAVEGRVCEVG